MSTQDQTPENKQPVFDLNKYISQRKEKKSLNSQSSEAQKITQPSSTNEPINDKNSNSALNECKDSTIQLKDTPAKSDQVKYGGFGSNTNLLNYGTATKTEESPLSNASPFSKLSGNSAASNVSSNSTNPTSESSTVLKGQPRTFPTAFTKTSQQDAKPNIGLGSFGQNFSKSQSTESQRNDGNHKFNLPSNSENKKFKFDLPRTPTSQDSSSKPIGSKFSFGSSNNAPTFNFNPTATNQDSSSKPNGSKFSFGSSNNSFSANFKAAATNQDSSSKPLGPTLSLGSFIRPGSNSEPSTGFSNQKERTNPTISFGQTRSNSSEMKKLQFFGNAGLKSSSNDDSETSSSDSPFGKPLQTDKKSTFSFSFSKSKDGQTSGTSMFASKLNQMRGFQSKDINNTSNQELQNQQVNSYGLPKSFVSKFYEMLFRIDPEATWSSIDQELQLLAPIINSH